MGLKENIKLSKSFIGPEEIDSVVEILKKGYFGMGPEVKLFEEELSRFFGREAICVNTGTSALQLALQSIGVGEGDEVLVQSLTYVACFQAISATGATPIACDVEPNTLTICLTDAKRKISPKTKAIMPVHYAGNPGCLEDIYLFGKQHNLRIVEDASHSFGSIYQGKLIGSMGDVCCISLDGIKNITSGEGGLILLDNSLTANKLRDIRLLGVEGDSAKRAAGLRSWNFDVSEQGWRYHMSDIMAAIGRAQLKKFSLLKTQRQFLATRYKQLLDQNHVRLNDADYSLIVPHIFAIRVNPMYRDRLVVHLENDHNISVGLHYRPNHLLTFYKDNQDNSTLSVTEEVYRSIITLPLHPGMTEGQVEFICGVVNNYLHAEV